MNMIAIILGVVHLIFYEASAHGGVLTTPMPFANSKNLMPGFDMEWTASDVDITFKLRVKATGWVGLGISPTSVPQRMTGADIVICGAMADGSNYIFDTIAPGNTRPTLDQNQDVQLLSASQIGGYTTVVFRRKLAGNGQDDVDITQGKVGIIYAFGTGPDPRTLAQARYHGLNRGETSLVLLMKKPKPMPSTTEKTATTTPVTMEGTRTEVPIPSPDTSDGDGTGEFDMDKLVVLERREASPSGQISVMIRIKDGNITFELTAKTKGWLGIGFSDEAGMKGADMIMCGYGKNGPYLYDTHGISNSLPIIDESQDVELLSGMQNGTHTTVTFTRKLIATDKNDMSIIRGKKLYFIYAIGCYDLVDGPHHINYHFLHRGIFFTDLTLSKSEDVDEKEDMKDNGDQEETFNGFTNGQQYLDMNNTVQLSWWNEDSSINIRLSAPTVGWIGFGVAPGKSMANSDIIMAGVSGGTPYIVDAFARRNGPPIRDGRQDVKLIAYSQNNTHTSITFQRNYTATGRHDALITDGPMNIIWAFGKRNVRLGKPRTGGYHGRNRGSAEVQLVNPGLRASLYPKGGKIVLDKKSEVILQWVLDDGYIFYQLGALTTGWLGLGISPGKNMRHADMAILGVNDDGAGYAFDTWAPSNKAPRVDLSQDVIFMAGREVDGRTVVIFQRPIKAVEKRVDRNTNEGELNLIWAFGQTDIGKVPRGKNYHQGNRGSVRVALIPLMDGNIVPVF